MILTSDDRNDYGYLFFLGRYLLSTSSMSILPESKLDTIDLLASDYIIAFEETEKTKAFLLELSPDGLPVVCLH